MWHWVMEAFWIVMQEGHWYELILEVPILDNIREFTVETPLVDFSWRLLLLRRRFQNGTTSERHKPYYNYVQKYILSSIEYKLKRTEYV